MEGAVLILVLRTGKELMKIMITDPEKFELKPN
jgi:hypothetical protein